MPSPSIAFKKLYIQGAHGHNFFVWVSQMDTIFDKVRMPFLQGPGDFRISWGGVVRTIEEERTTFAWNVINGGAVINGCHIVLSRACAFNSIANAGIRAEPVFSATASSSSMMPEAIGRQESNEDRAARIKAEARTFALRDNGYSICQYRARLVGDKKMQAMLEIPIQHLESEKERNSLVRSFKKKFDGQQQVVEGAIRERGSRMLVYRDVPTEKMCRLLNRLIPENFAAAKETSIKWNSKSRFRVRKEFERRFDYVDDDSLAKILRGVEVIPKGMIDIGTIKPPFNTQKRTYKHLHGAVSASKKPRQEKLVPVKVEPYQSPTIEFHQPDLLDVGKDENIHVKIDRSQEQCIKLLQKAREFVNLPQLHSFCSPAQRTEWNKEIDDMMKQREPEIVIGCLGGTGVGKSSLLKALLNEDKILPTSSSRGCTAAVIELKFNREFLKPQGQVTVYKGEIEFITLQDWKDELSLLIDDCCDDEDKVSLYRSEESEDIAAAWKKIDSVYGFGTMDSHDGMTKDEVYKTLSEDTRVVTLLGSGSEGKYNLIEVTEGQVTASESVKLLDIMRDPSKTIDKKLVRKKKRWVNSFRKRINNYVYRKGNGKEPQTWPLIRKVVLQGPWNVLSTGVCLVDLPGVGDDNAARAKVAEKYLQNCTKLWIFAPIKRAVDDKIAKDLLGNEFKRRLLMDGNYGNVSFICTHSDDCEISEIMNDHEDVAKEEPGRWEQMLSLRETISLLSKTDDDIEDEMDDIEDKRGSILKELEDIRQRISTASSSSSDQALLKAWNASEKTLAEELNQLQRSSESLMKQSSETPESRDERKKECHKKLKVLASRVRNEYSTKSLQEDFRHGIEELARKPSVEEMQEGEVSNKPSVALNFLPEDFNLEVFCTASNEYLKLQGVKTGSDGNAVCFSSLADTGIPDVIQSVFDTTKKSRAQYASLLVKKTGSFLGRIYLYASSQSEIDEKVSNQYANSFELEKAKLIPVVNQIAQSFGIKMKDVIRKELEPKLLMAANRGDNESIGVLNAWFSCLNRNRQAPKNKGLHWATIGAACRRNGVFKSSSAGPVSLNQELLNPLEDEFCRSWRKVMVGELKNHINEAKNELSKLCKDMLQSVSKEYAEIGLDSLSVQLIKTAGYQESDALINNIIGGVHSDAIHCSRSLNRSSLEKIQENMSHTYSSVVNVAPGLGKSSRQMLAMKAGGKTTLTLQKFSPMMIELRNLSIGLVEDIEKILMELHSKVHNCLEKVCCPSWLDGEYVVGIKNDPKVFVEVFDSRNALLPNLVRLCAAHDNVMDYMNMPREVIDRVEANLPSGFIEARENLIGRDTDGRI